MPEVSDAAASADELAAVLVLEDGRYWRGRTLGATGTCVGEVVFNTAMTGYQETLTDPSYRRQIVVMTAPHIGNTGMNAEDAESNRIWVAGLVVRNPSVRASNFRATGELDDELRAAGVVGISGIDTRAITRHVRERGALRGGIFTGADAVDLAEAVRTVRQVSPMVGADLSAEVSTTEPYEITPPPGVAETGLRVVAVDLGIKNRTPQLMAERGVRVTVVPAAVTLADIKTYHPDGVFFSNGPGDPATADVQVDLLREILRADIAFFGICLGHQLLGRALGFDTYKLTYGHRGINQPVLDRVANTVEITAHNHGFAVQAPLDHATDTEFGPVEVSHLCLNDDVVEGLRCRDIPAFSVQYHPEAAAGPHDAQYLFDRWVELMRESKTSRKAAV